MINNRTPFFERLDEFFNYKNLNDNQVTVETKIPNGLIGKGRIRGSLSLKNIAKILNTYKSLDANWLLTGKGEMFLKDNQTKISSDTKAQKDSLNKLFYNYMELTADTNKNQLTSNDVRNIKELLNNL